MAKIIINDIFDELRDENIRLLNENKFILNLLKKQRKSLLNLQNICDYSNEYSKTKLKLEIEIMIEALDKEFNGFIDSNADNFTENDHKSEDEDQTETKDTQSKSGYSDDNCDNKSKDSDFDSDSDSDFICDISPKPSNYRTKRYRYPCEECGQIFRSNITFAAHLQKIHDSEKPFKCQDCGQYFDTKLNLKYHNRSHRITNRRKFFSCNECERKFLKQSLLKTHIEEYHSLEPTIYRCDKCEYCTKFSEQFKRHSKRMHSTVRGEPNIKCEYEDCNKMFTQIYNMRKHLQYFHSQKIWQCDEAGCERSFKCQYYYDRHKSSHLGIFFCGRKDCNQQFSNEQDLRQHKQSVHRLFVHRLESVFKCDWPGCDYRGNYLKNLQDHKRTHLRIRQFKCSYNNCGKTFVQAKTLHRHELSHRKRHMCSWPGCGQLFPINLYLERHMKKCHKT